MTNVFEEFLASPEASEVFSETSIVQAMLDFEASLARAKAEVGVIPAAAANTIAQSCKAQLFDIAQIVRESRRAGNLAIPLVSALQDNVALFNPDAARHVHWGATSQDAIDSAMVLATRRALDLIEADGERLVKAIVALARTHAATPMLARTLIQPALVTTFGWKCAGWAQALHHCRCRLALSRRSVLQLQLGGSAETLDRLGEHADAIARHMADELGVALSSPWHTQREAWVGLGADLALLAGSVGKIARDVSLLSQSELSELAEPFEEEHSGSSMMSHKRNSVAVLIANCAALRVPQRLACLLAAFPQENERGLGGWQVELAEWPSLVISVHGALRAMANAIEGLQVFPQRMRANIDATRGVIFAESVAAILAGVLGPREASGLVRELCGEVQADPRLMLADLLLKTVARRAALRGKIDSTRIRAAFEIEPIAERLAARTLEQVKSIEANEASAGREGVHPPQVRSADKAQSRRSRRLRLRRNSDADATA